MPEPFDVGQLGLDRQSEIHQLLQRFPDIEACHYRDGEFLIREQEESDDVFLVLRGAYVVERAPATPGGRPVILACVMCESDSISIVGEMSYFGLHQRSASVRSAGATHALRLGPAHLDTIISDFPALTRVLCHQFSRRLRETNQALHELREKFDLAPRQRLAQPGEVLFTRGDEAAELYQVVAGTLRLKGEAGTETTGPETLEQGFLEPGPFLRGTPQTVTATADSTSLPIVIGASHNAPPRRSHPELALRLLEPPSDPLP